MFVIEKVRECKNETDRKRENRKREGGTNMEKIKKTSENMIKRNRADERREERERFKKCTNINRIRMRDDE